MQTIAQILTDLDLAQFDLSAEHGDANKAYDYLETNATLVNRVKFTMSFTVGPISYIEVKEYSDDPEAEGMVSCSGVLICSDTEKGDMYPVAMLTFADGEDVEAVQKILGALAKTM